MITDADRIERILRYTGLNIRQLSMELGMRFPQTLYDIKKGKHGISKDFAEKIKDRFKDFNLIWILTGEGEMLNQSNNSGNIAITNASHSIASNGDVNYYGCGQAKTHEQDEDCIPVIPRHLYDAAGVDVLEYIAENDVPTSPTVKQFPKHDMYYNVFSDEMAPIINKGDKLAISPYELGMEHKVVDNRVYVVDTKHNGLMLRKLYKTENGFRAEPENKEYSTEYIEKDDIIRVYRVLGLLRIHI